MLRKIQIIALFLAIFSAKAYANDAVVPPLVTTNIDKKENVRFTRLIASEVEYLDIFESVEELEYKTTKIDSKCIKSTACLYKMAKSNNANSIVAGKVNRKGKNLVFELRYIKKGKMVRKLKFSILNKTSIIADEMGGHVTQLITGKAPKTVESSASAKEVDELPEIDDEDLEDDPLGGLNLKGNSKEARAADRAKRKREAAEKKRLAEEARLRREAEARRRAEEAERQRLAQEKSELAGLDDDEDLDSEEDKEYELDLRQHKSRINQKAKKVQQPKVEDDLDDSFSPRRAATTVSSKSGTAPKATVTGRVGTAKFQELNFVTYGGEIGYYLNDRVSIVAGADAHATQRKIPTEYLADGEDPYQWNTILPINIGGLYHMPLGPATLQLGGDLVIIPGYVRNAGGAAMGLRLRIGSNFMVSDAFGFNVNVAAGFWSGEDFEQVQSNLSSTGMAPQFSGGTVFAF